MGFAERGVIQYNKLGEKNVDLLAERNEQIESLKQIEQAIAQLEKQFTEMQTQRERVIGAILLIDKWLNVENEQQKALVDVDRG